MGAGSLGSVFSDVGGSCGSPDPSLSLGVSGTLVSVGSLVGSDGVGFSGASAPSSSLDVVVSTDVVVSICSDVTVSSEVVA